VLSGFAQRKLKSRIVPTHEGMARLSWPGWLVTYRDQPPGQLTYFFGQLRQLSSIDACLAVFDHAFMKNGLICYLCTHTYMHVYVFLSLAAVLFAAVFSKLLVTTCDWHSGIKGVLTDWTFETLLLLKPNSSACFTDSLKLSIFCLCLVILLICALWTGNMGTCKNEK